jgi:hypothetical protein
MAGERNISTDNIDVAMMYAALELTERSSYQDKERQMEAFTFIFKEIRKAWSSADK